MTFNNDVSVTDVFSEIYRIIMGKESTGFTILEVSYSVGLALGIVGFFNHFAKFKINTDPTPLEVEMRLYEDNVSKTLIQNDGRKAVSYTHLANVVKTTVLLQNIGDFGAMNEVYATFFEGACPARAAFEVAALPKAALVEIEAIAYCGE